MNNWTAIGYIFIGFGLVFLVLALSFGIGIAALYGNSLLSGLIVPAALAVMFPWVVVSALCFVVGIVGVVAGRRPAIQKQNHISAPVTSKQSTNRWPLIGYLLLGFGLLFLIFGFFQGYLTASEFDTSTVDRTVIQRAFFNTIFPWVVVSATCFLIGIVSMIAGLQKKASHA